MDAHGVVERFADLEPAGPFGSTDGLLGSEQPSDHLLVRVRPIEHEFSDDGHRRPNLFG
jgi:hypothetical protein